MEQLVYKSQSYIGFDRVWEGAEASSTWVRGGRILQMNWRVSFCRPVHIQPGYGCNWPHHHLLRCLVHFFMNLSVLGPVIL